MPSAATTHQPSQQQQHQQHRFKDGQPQYRSSSSRTINPATGMPDRVGNYNIREEIGRGSFATVYRGEKVTTNPATLVAIKAVVRSKLTSKLLENLESEIRLLKGIKQRNVVELVDCLKTEAHIYLVMAYCSAGDLSQYIRKRGQIPSLTSSMHQAYRERYPHPRDGGLNELVVRCFLGQLAEALKFLRNQNIIHRDIKPQNLLLHPPDVSDIDAGHPQGIPLLRVADFGFARALPNTSLAETLCGSPLYMAPEILRYEKYDAKADLWSVGAVTYEMTTGKPPFRAQNHVELLRRIERGEDRIKFPDDKSPTASAVPVKEEVPPTKVPDDLKDIIRGLLKRNPVERMSFADFFREADSVARWGEGSLVAPGTINESQQNPAPSNQTSGYDQLSLPQSTSRVQSGRNSPSPVIKGTPVPSLPPPSPIIKDLSSAVEIPIIPSSGEEQEMAFVPLPVTGRPASQSNNDSLAVEGLTDVPEQIEPSSARPSAPNRRSTFKPKYIVGTEVAQNSGPSAALKTRDYAVITTTAPTPAARAPQQDSAGQTRRLSQESLPSRQGLTDTTPQTPPRSNLTLVLPNGRERQPVQQGELTTSAMTGDDDSILGREYVVVDKKNVEFNALADEMASGPRRQHALSRRSSRGILSRQATGYGQSLATPATYGNLVANHAQSPSPPSPVIPYPPTAQAVAYEHPPFAMPTGARLSPAPYGSSPRSRGNPIMASGQGSPGRCPSTASTGQTVDQAYASPLSIVGGITLPSHAISKALNMASLKLFGSPSENIWLRRHSHRLPFARRRSRQSFTQEEIPSAEEDELMQKLEDIAQKAIVIFDFADSKLVMMQPQSSQQSLPSNQRSPLLSEGTTNLSGIQAGLGTSQASPFFATAARNTGSPGPSNRRTSSSGQRPTSPLIKGTQTSLDSAHAHEITTFTSSARPDLLPGETLVLYLKALAFLSKGIEQARDFWSARTPGQAASVELNEYVQWFRARFNECFDKAEYAKGRLLGDIPDSAMLAEKLIFDRALEVSRAAAVSELMGENTQECEIAYETALWMLYAILDETMQEGELVDEEDTVTVRNFIESIKGRLGALRRKMQKSSIM